jgi:hypothetical protein
MSRLAHTDRARGVVVRYQRERPGELVHLDVKKLGRIPDGGGHRIHGRAKAARGRGIGYDYRLPPAGQYPGHPMVRTAASWSGLLTRLLRRPFTNTLRPRSTAGVARMSSERPLTP